MNNYEKRKLEPKIFNCSKLGVESMEGTGVLGRGRGWGFGGGAAGTCRSSGLSDLGEHMRNTWGKSTQHFLVLHIMFPSLLTEPFTY